MYRALSVIVRTSSLLRRPLPVRSILAGVHTRFASPKQPKNGSRRQSSTDCYRKCSKPFVSICVMWLVGCASEHTSAMMHLEAASDALHPVPQRADWPKRPNILWITIEDCSPLTGAYGNAWAKTPALDQLAQEGLLFEQAFAPTGVCSSSRHALITGCWATSTGAMHHRAPWRNAPTAKDGTSTPLPPGYEAIPPAGVHLFPEILRAHGYFCTNNKKQDYQLTPPVTTWDRSDAQAHWRQRPHHGTDQAPPFFAVFNSTQTHEKHLFAQSTPKLTDRRAIPVPPYLPDTPAQRECLARQMDNLAAADIWVESILEQLEEDGLADNTVVFFFSDHGSATPRGKRWVLDSGTRVPLIVRFPDGWMAGQRTDQLVSFVDFAPTLLSLAGLAIPDAMQGKTVLRCQASRSQNTPVSCARPHR